MKAGLRHLGPADHPGMTIFIMFLLNGADYFTR